MSTDWNPNKPGLLGLEWLPVVQAGDVIASDGACFAQTLDSTAAETIDTILLTMSSIATPGRYILEVYPAGSEVAGAVTTTTYRPNEDTNDFDVENEVGATVNLYQSVDEATVDYSDYIVNSNATIFGNLWTFKLNTATFGAALRVVAMRWVSRGRQVVGQHTWEWAIRKDGEGFLRLLRTAYSTADGRFVATAHLGEINPFTGMPWLESEIESFDSTVSAGRLSLRWGLAEPVDTSSQARLHQTYLEIDTVTENRVAYGCADIGASTTVEFTMQAPDGTDNWAKADNTTYTYVLRRIPEIGNPDDPTAGPLGASVGNVSWQYLDDQAAGVPATMLAAAYAPTLDVGGTIVELGDPLVRARSLHLKTTGAVGSVDGLYRSRISYVPTTPPDESQGLTTAAATTYDAVAFVVGIVDAANPPSSDLLVRVRRTSDNVQMGGDGTLTLAEFEALEQSTQGYAVAVVEFAVAPSLAATTAYYVEWESADIAAEGWEVPYLGFVTGSAFGAASMGGTTDRVRVLATGEADDFAMLLIEYPPAVADLAATVEQQALPGDGTNCSVDYLEYVALTWTASVFADFSAYEIERSFDGGTTWEQIAVLTSIAAEAFDDYEGLRGVEASYRIRQVAYALDIAGPWSATVTATPDAVDCEVLFVSNEQPALNVAYIDEGGERVYELQDAERAVLYPIVDRDGQVALQPSEHLGDRWAMQLVVHAIAEPSPGRTIFDALEDLSRADLPHVTVLDSDGNRWIALLQVPQATRTEPGHLYVAEAIVTTLAFTPTPVTS